MADVKIIDIDGEQWNIKDQPARDKITDIEKNISVQGLQDVTTYLSDGFQADSILLRNHYKIGKVHFIDINIKNIKGYNLGTDQTAPAIATNLHPVKETSFILADSIAPAILRCLLEEDGTIAIAESKGLVNGNNNIYGELIFAEP